MNEKIWLSSPHMSDEGYEMEFIQEAFDTNWISPLGANVNGFEAEVVELVGGGMYAAALVTGSAAIHMSLKAAGVNDGDIVLCQSLTFSGSANPIKYMNAIPVFIDSDRETWNMSPKSLEEALIKYPKAKGVIVVHLYGFSANMDEIMKICRRYNVFVIEDAAESLGAYYKGQHTGTIGDYGTFSFNGNKIITTSGGGMLISKNKERIDKVKFWSSQSKDKARYYQHSEVGYNYRMSNVLAGIGRGQLKVLEKRVAKKKYINDYYKNAFKEIPEIEFMPIQDWDKPNFWLSCITVLGKIKPMDIILALENDNIEARLIWKPMHLEPIFAEYDFIGEGICEEIFNTGLCLPSDTKMTDEDLERICHIITDLWR